MQNSNSNGITWISTDNQTIYTGRHRDEFKLCTPGLHMGPFITIQNTEYCENCGAQVSQQWTPFIPAPSPWNGCTCLTTNAYWCPVHGYRYGQNPVIWCGSNTGGLQASA